MVDSHSRKLFDKNGMLIVRAIEPPEEHKRIHKAPKVRIQNHHALSRFDKRVRVVWVAIALTFSGKKVPYREMRNYFQNNGVSKVRFACVCKRLESEGKLKIKRKNGRMAMVEVLA